MNEIEKYKQIKKQVNEIIKSYIQLEKYNNKFDNLNASHLKLYIIKQEHELHCLCVELWISEYSNERYWDKILNPDSTHEYIINFRKPTV